MLLAIDIGNSNIVLGLSSKNDWIKVWRLPTLENDIEFYYEIELRNRFLEANIKLDEIKQIIVSSVVPDINIPFLDTLYKLFGFNATLIEPTAYSKIEIQIDNPREIGTDLVANAVAAHHLLKKNCIIVDFGTALTFTTVNKEGHILGVSIVPGLKTAIRALFSKTAQLPEVPMEIPSSALGKNTVHAIQSGIFYGYTGLVSNMLTSIRKEVGEDYVAIATGGLSSSAPHLKEYFERLEPNLTLNGLRLIAKVF